MSPRLRDSLSALNFFALVCLSALSISFIVSIIVYNLGIPAAAGDYVRLNLFITGCIAIPTAVIATLNDVQSRAYQRRLEELAWTDDLTGLLNRRFFLRAADKECRRMRRTQQSAAVAIIDLDFFKEVNDLYGHAAGDRVLKAVAQIAHAELRGPFDKLGRWGGEEFVVLLTDVTPEKARIVCDRLRSRIQTAMIDTGLYQVYVTASFGFCMLNPGADAAWHYWVPGLAQYQQMMLVLKGEALGLARVLPPLLAAAAIAGVSVWYVAREMRAAASR